VVHARKPKSALHKSVLSSRRGWEIGLTTEKVSILGKQVTFGWLDAPEEVVFADYAL
jgi:hypothetical protein